MTHVAQQRLTIRQIADLAGVSIATVSRVLNGRGDVSDETRDLVTRVVRENGYTANRGARHLSAGRTGLVGILVPLVYPAYFSTILGGAAQALSERDLQIVLSPTGGEHDREVSVLDRLHALTDGAQIIGPRGWLATEDRRRGYRAALAAAGILPDPALEVETEPEIGPGRDAAT